MRTPPTDDTGDTIEVSVTHEIKIDGEKTWVGTRYNTTVKDTETVEDAHARADAVVQSSVMTSINNTVSTVKEFTS